MAAKREIKTILSLDGEQKYKEAIKSINKEQQALNAETKAAKAAFEASGDEQAKLQVQSENLAKQIELQKQKVEEAQNALEQSKKIYGENADETNGYRIELAKAEEGLAKMESQLLKTNTKILENESGLKKAGEMAEKAGEKISKAGEKMDKLGDGLTKGVTAPIVAAGTGLLALGTKFDDAVDTIRIGTGATGEALQGLEDDFDAVIGRVPADMSDAASAIADINTRLGLTGEPLQNLAQQYLELAHITGEDVTGSIKETTRAFNAWQIPADKMEDGLNTLFKTSQATGIGVNDLAKKVTDFAPALQELGFSFEESAALVGKFEQAGVNTDGVLAALKKSVASFAKEGKSASEGLAEVTQKIKGASDESEAAKIAMETFGSKAGPELAYQIRQGRLDIDDLTKSLQESGETIGGAAEDTYDYAEEWKMLANQLAKDLKPVAQQVFDALKAATPILKEGAQFVGNLAEKFSKLSPAQQETILKMVALAAAAGPVIKTTSKIADVVGGATTKIGGYIKKLGEKKAAEAAADVASSGVAKSIGGITSALGPVGLAITGVVAVFGGLLAALHASDEAANAWKEDFAEAGNEVMEGMASWPDTVANAESALSGLNTEVYGSSDALKELEGSIQTTQENVVEIAKTAAEESRAYTDKEREQIEELIGLLEEYTEEKIAAYQKQSDVLRAQIELEDNMTEEHAASYVKSAQEMMDQTIATAKAGYNEQILAAQEAYGAQGELDQEAYNAALEAAKARYDEETEAAQTAYGDMVAMTAEKYASQNEEMQKYADDVLAHNNRILELQAEANSEELYQRADWAQRQIEINEEIDAEQKKLGEAYKGLASTGGDAWLQMNVDAEMYGGKLTDKTKTTAGGIIDSFNHLPEDMTQTGRDTLQGMMTGMEEKSGSLFDKVAGIGTSLLHKMQSVLGIASPSKEMRKIMNWFFAGAENPIKEAQKKLPKEMGDIAQGMIDEAAKVAQAEEYFRGLLGTSSGARLNWGGSPYSHGALYTEALPAGGIDKSRKITQNFYGDIHASGTGERNATLQQLQFMAQL